MQYIIKENDKVIGWTGCQMGATWFTDNNWIPYEGSAQLQYLDIVDGVIIDNSPTPEELERAQKLARHVFTRLQIRGAFIALGMEPTLDLLLANNPVFDRYWFEAQEIDTNHEVTQQAMSMFSEEEQEALILAIV